MRPLSRTVSAVLTLVSLLLSLVPVEARTRKGDKLLAQGRAAEVRGDLDRALEFDENALSEDPSDPLYQLETRRVRFNTAARHIKTGQKIRAEGHLSEALLEFTRAYAIDPASPLSQQEIRRTKEMIEREKKKQAQPAAPGAPPSNPEDRGLTPAQTARKATMERLESLQPVPELRALNPQPFTLKMNNQKPRVLFETVGKIAGINVLFDPDYEAQNAHQQSIELQNATLEQSLDYLALLTKSFWKPLSANAIFVTLDNVTKRREVEEQVVKVFYLSNITSTTEVQEVITTLRTVAEIQKVYQYTSQNAVIVRCEADRMLLAEKIISDLDKPKSEVVVDVVVMEVRKDRVRNLGAQIANGGLSVNGIFTPRASLLGATTNTTASGTNTGTTSGTGTLPTTTSTTTSATTNSGLTLNNLKHITSQDYSITGIPGGFIEALLSDTGTKVLQSPQLRAVDNVKVSLHIGDKVPTASGSFGSGIGGVGVGVSPLVQTQFTYIETGVNMDMQARVHDANQVTLHIEIDISQVTGYRDVGGIQQPIISQRKVSQDIRTEDGEINLMGGLIQEQDSKVVQGLPGLSQIPLLRRLFSDEKIEKSQTELLITLIPHIVRSPDLTESNLRGISSGTTANVHVTRGAAAVPPSSLPVPPQSGPAPASPAPTALPPATAAPAPEPAPTTTPGGPVVLSFLPAIVETPLSSATTVTLRAANISDLSAINAQLKFDPKILRVTRVVAGDLIQQTGPPLSPSQNILNDAGEAIFSVARDPKGPGVSGSGGLVTVTFQAVGRGSTTVTVTQLMLKNTPGQPVAANTPVLNVTVK